MSTYIKCKEVRHIEAQQIENLFAGNIRNLLMDAKLDYDKLYEIRLRVGRPLFLTYDGGECFLRKPGQEQYLVTTEDLKEIYHQRWGIETGFRELKYILGMSAFHSKQENSILQEIPCMLMRMRSDRDLSVFRVVTE